MKSSRIALVVLSFCFSVTALADFTIYQLKDPEVLGEIRIDTTDDGIPQLTQFIVSFVPNSTTHTYNRPIFLSDKSPGLISYERGEVKLIGVGGGDGPSELDGLITERGPYYIFRTVQKSETIYQFFLFKNSGNLYAVSFTGTVYQPLKGGGYRIAITPSAMSREIPTQIISTAVIDPELPEPLEIKARIGQSRSQRIYISMVVDFKGDQVQLRYLSIHKPRVFWFGHSEWATLNDVASLEVTGSHSLLIKLKGNNTVLLDVKGEDISVMWNGVAAPKLSIRPAVIESNPAVMIPKSVKKRYCSFLF